ncbi:MAG: hypothetical protein ThorAB25_19120 [Candidatus Thorarchaeota archaeon AB_25]|nr:MAG: hypothetical protein ThorAB25_19120 [Candidatus Thorarchaeota archaeon AB_25]
MDEDSSNSEDMAEDLIDAIDDVSDEDDVGDGLTKKEREIDVSRESERQRKAQELRKQLRRRQLGILTYRWPAFVLIVGGFLAITTEFLQVIIREPGVPPEVGFNTFIDALLRSGGVIYLFPVIGGVFMIVLSYFAYKNPRATWLALIPAAMLAMAGSTVYFLVTFAVTADPTLEGLIYASPTPISMIIAAVVALLAVALKEKED